MKVAFFLAVIIFAATANGQVTNKNYSLKNLPTRFQPKAKVLSLVKPTTFEELKALTALNTNPSVIQTPTGKLTVLPQDHMVCVVPDLTQFNMPVVKPDMSQFNMPVVNWIDSSK